MEGFRLPNYLQMYRKQSGLTQEELGRLLGCESSRRYERRQRLPGLATLISYEIVFGVGPEQLFAGVYEETEGLTQQRAQSLIRDLAEKSDDLESTAKIDFLKNLIARIAQLPTTADDLTT